MVRRSKRLFNCVSTDQALEQTVNREAQSQGGAIGFTKRKGALLRWLMTRHITGSYSEAMKEMCTTAARADDHEEIRSSRLARDVTDVDKISDALISQFQNPFHQYKVPWSTLSLVT